MVRRNGAANVHELPTIHCPLFTIFLGGYMRVGIATDHGGFWLKEDLLARLAAAGKVERGIAVCGSGVGASVCANKVPGVRVDLISNHFSARQGVADNQTSV